MTPLDEPIRLKLILVSPEEGTNPPELDREMYDLVKQAMASKKQRKLPKDIGLIPSPRAEKMETSVIHRIEQIAAQNAEKVAARKAALPHRTSSNWKSPRRNMKPSKRFKN